ncbi:glycosyl transferase [Leptolyngbya cf. ectocarpi LEGE 11479]|uniref:Glycosyl transferase n=1 Tax=Leptolyngbya cf. ectocarpi LEGE 11479 TaxID=1828722 RepID=A0A928ZVS3_LEPEC|nr:glycosyltransferase [Leptolyngbya ectocarpi]MBE9068387.1 glycosyl transferase [Leptolyngbya cf. ectocarpi LEGE 11479]
MKTLLFYCQHILGIGHLIRSMAIVRGLSPDFQVYFVNGGEVIQDFPIPEGIEVINLPAIKTDSNFRELQVPAGFTDIDAALAYRRELLLEVCDRIRPTAVMVELFPFGRRRFSTELIPLLERAKDYGAKTICSLRDIVVTKQDQARHEVKVCKLMNRHFDQLLIHGDPDFVPLENSFSRVQDLTCDVYYTGYVVPDMDRQFAPRTEADPPTILVSVGGGRFGHELLTCVADASQFLADQIPHHIQMFTGPFAPDDIFGRLSAIAALRPNLTVQRYTPDLLSYMAKADLSISMAGYNTTLNVLQTGVPAMQLPFTGNDDQEQRLRSTRLEELGIVKVIAPNMLEPTLLAREIIKALEHRPTRNHFCLRGVETTAIEVKALVEQEALV